MLPATVNLLRQKSNGQSMLLFLWLQIPILCGIFSQIFTTDLGLPKVSKQIRPL
jgi:hypothetical protein